jgi:hypothetical protein
VKDTRIVKIKTWDRMVEEFGLHSRICINCENGFIDDMDKLLPKNRIIKISKVKTTDDFCYVWEGWTISEDMIEDEYTLETHPQYFI